VSLLSAFLDSSPSLDKVGVSKILETIGSGETPEVILHIGKYIATLCARLWVGCCLVTLLVKESGGL